MLFVLKVNSLSITNLKRAFANTFSVNRQIINWLNGKTEFFLFKWSSHRTLTPFTADDQLVGKRCNLIFLSQQLLFFLWMCTPLYLVYLSKMYHCSIALDYKYWQRYTLFIVGFWILHCLVASYHLIKHGGPVQWSKEWLQSNQKQLNHI